MEDHIKQILLTEIQRLFIEQKEDKENIQNFMFLTTNYPFLSNLISKNDIKLKEWESLVRESLFFKENDIRYMYDRIMQIVRRFNQMNREYFEIKNQSGTYLIPDRLSDFNKLFQLYESLFFKVYPKIVNELNINSLNIENTSTLLSGKVNWNKTIVQNLLGDESNFPLQFTILTSQSSLQNTENILFLSYIIRVGIDSKIIRGYHFRDPLKNEEKLILKNIEEGCNKLVNNITILHPMMQKAIEYANLTVYDSQLINLENIVINKIKDGIIRQKGYNLLLDWIQKYRQLNIRIISPNHTNFPIDNIENLDTMFEIWILFELLDFLDLHLSAKITKFTSLKNQYKIKLNNYEFDLIYQKKYSGWIRESEPDYTIEIKGKLKVILDAKNWSDRKDEAIYKMLGYLNNLDGELGVLFFPNVIDIDKFEYKGLNLKNHINQSIINCVLPLSGEDKIEQKKLQLEKLFEVILSCLNKKKIDT